MPEAHKREKTSRLQKTGERKLRTCPEVSYSQSIDGFILGRPHLFAHAHASVFGIMCLGFRQGPGMIRTNMRSAYGVMAMALACPAAREVE